MGKACEKLMDFALNFFFFFFFFLIGVQQMIRIRIAAVVSIALYLTDKGEHTALYKINKKCIHQSLKSHNYISIRLYHARTCAQKG